jgi:hypothetical protein
MRIDRAVRCGQADRTALLPLRSLVRVLALTLTLGAGLSPAAATPLHVARELEGPGLSVSAAGAGLKGSRSVQLTVDVRGPVALALLVWSGRGPCRVDPATSECGLGAAPFADQAMTLDGALLSAQVLGFELVPEADNSQTLNVGYLADVTEAVAARGTGRLTFTVADADRRNNLRELDGAGLLVAYSDPAVAGSFRLMIGQGLDFAYGESLVRGDSQATAALSFVHGAAKAPRNAQLLLFVGGAEAQRPDRIEVTHRPDLFDRLNGSEGVRFDIERVPFGIAGAAGTTTVQIFSEPVGENPDSFAWSLAALHLPLAGPAGCPAAFWNGHPDAWRGVRTSQKLGDVFGTKQHYSSLSEATLLLATRFKDGPGLLGAAKALLREGTAALLNAAHPEVEFPLTRTQVLHRVGDALETQDAQTLLMTAEELAAMNSAGCPLD